MVMGQPVASDLANLTYPPSKMSRLIARSLARQSIRPLARNRFKDFWREWALLSLEKKAPPKR